MAVGRLASIGGKLRFSDTTVRYPTLPQTFEQISLGHIENLAGLGKSLKSIYIGLYHLVLLLLLFGCCCCLVVVVVVVVALVGGEAGRGGRGLLLFTEGLQSSQPHRVTSRFFNLEGGEKGGLISPSNIIQTVAGS